MSAGVPSRRVAAAGSPAPATSMSHPTRREFGLLCLAAGLFALPTSRANALVALVASPRVTADSSRRVADILSTPVNDE
ncbi:hypothetical protein [Afifella sp. IM 167]|uniref:hypothetical protein n=1 Tax=Afifella sp. IM 167 TaxID=2033586 RepID=UPI001CCB9F7D|nr:hypothetical protein [Afifella sp. IM 167]MBZ8133272.1 hypothetical protein [Afifella sp. IM 167]